jgi:hypothetical protein
MATLHNVFSRVHSLPPAARMPRFAPAAQLTTRAVRQPQSRMAAPRGAAFFALPKEPEDARLTGGTRSLDRRLLALNLRGNRTSREFSSFELLLAG